jgi:hypothetical protein
MKAKDFDFKDLTEKIIGCAYRVYNSMGFGFVESVYEKCMIIELRKIGLIVETQKAMSLLANRSVCSSILASELLRSSANSENYERFNYHPVNPVIQSKRF